MPAVQKNTLKFLAQAFSVAVSGEATGIYLTRIGLFFRKKADASSLRLFLLEMKNGVPDRESTLSNSVVVLNSEQIQISEDASGETIFEFSQPVFLDASKQYCFAIQSPDPEFTLWGATQGERDISTDKIVNNNPLTESAFYSESNAEYSELPNQDVKFVLYRAKFDTSRAGVANLRNRENLEYLRLADVSVIENLNAQTTDKICQLSEPSIEKAKYLDLFKTSDNQYIMLVETSDSSVFSIGEQIVLYRETVVEGTTYRTELLTGTIDLIPSYEYHSVLPRLNIEKTSGTSASFALRGAVADGSSYTLESDFNISASEYTEQVLYDKPRYLLSHSAERNIISASSFQMLANLTTDNEYVAPIIRFDSSHVALLTNLINDDLTDETTREGKASAKYISRIVSLADGMDAEDVKLYIDAYKPKNTEIHVYGKFQNSEDFSNFDNLPWIKLSQVTPENIYSDPKDQTDYREYEFEIPAEYKNSDGIFTYTGTGDQSGTFIRYKKYSIKIVMTTVEDYEFNPPKVTDLRVIALQK